MKRLLLLLLALLAAPAFGQDEPPSDVQWLKAKGHFRHVQLEHIESMFIDGEKFQEQLEQGALICGTPEHADRELATAPIDWMSTHLNLPEDICKDIQQMHKQRLILESTGSGSFPAGCHPDWPDNHVASYYVDRASFPAHYKREVSDQEWQRLVDAGVWPVDSVEECKRFFVYRTEEHARAASGTNGDFRKRKGDVLNLMDAALVIGLDLTYRRVGILLYEVHTGPDGDHNLHIRSRVIPGSVIGYAFFNNRTCNSHVEHVIDASWRPGLHPLCGLFAHEAGHNNNLQHTFRPPNHGIMSYSQRYPYEGFSPGTSEFREARDPSWSPLTRYYGGDPFPEIDPEDPEDPDEPDDPPTGDWHLEVGDFVTMTMSGRKVTLEVTDIEGDDGPGLAERVAEALKAIPPYERFDQHRRTLSQLYRAMGRAVDSEKISFDDAAEGLVKMRSILLGDKTEAWAGVFAVADLATSAKGLLHVASGLAEGEAFLDDVIQAIELIIAIRNGDWARAIELIQALLDRDDDGEAAMPASAQKVSACARDYALAC